ncbi:hypothetical protein [Ovoidimarina sediminis]|uniref:hypothetical protein n=1 Tax=Ovoidimarina sediminis TaxID=3079856 RepID=UPI00291525CC|nr:hypothetical protein [Rhodophyticola sp. MJ-SS7]MDU8946208.1 hypothetical protein [Rhodophyticola sp. MJ-SS7]
MADYIDYLEQQLNIVDQGIARTRRHFETSDVSGKVAALADLRQLESRRDALTSRIAEAKEMGADQWSDFHVSLKEEADALRDTIESWLTRLG